MKNTVFCVVRAEMFYPGQLEKLVQLSYAREVEKKWRCSSVDSSVGGYSPDSNGVTTEALESPLLRSVTRKRLVKAD
jgi:hypothetical protein